MPRIDFKIGLGQLDDQLFLHPALLDINSIVHMDRNAVVASFLIIVNFISRAGLRKKF